jgi:hypothetical protein
VTPIERPFDTDAVSTKDEILSAELHGEALLIARRPELQPLIDHFREVAQGRDDRAKQIAANRSANRPVHRW